MLCAGVCACAVGHGQTIYLLLALRKNSDNFSRLSIGADDKIADFDFAHFAPTAWCYQQAVQRLCSASHECQWRDFDHALLNELRHALVIDQIEERVVKRP